MMENFAEAARVEPNRPPKIWWLRLGRPEVIEPLGPATQMRRRGLLPWPLGLAKRAPEAATGALATLLLTAPDPQFRRFDWLGVLPFAVLGVVEGWFMLRFSPGAVGATLPVACVISAALGCWVATRSARRLEESGMLDELRLLPFTNHDVASTMMVAPCAVAAAGAWLLDTIHLLFFWVLLAREAGPWFLVIVFPLVWTVWRMRISHCATNYGVYLGWRAAVEQYHQGAPMPRGIAPWSRRHGVGGIIWIGLMVWSGFTMYYAKIPTQKPSEHIAGLVFIAGAFAVPFFYWHRRTQAADREVERMMFLPPPRRPPARQRARAGRHGGKEPV